MRTVALKKRYRKAKVEIPVLRGIDLEIRAGEFLAIVGQSGSGKSTLLHLMATLDAPDSGEIWFHDEQLTAATPRRRDVLRNEQIGMIFQFYHLVPELTCLENVLSPLMIREGAWSFFRRRKQMRERAMSLLKQVGLEHRATHKPREMSGGEMQRAAIARALIAGPKLLLADEPTGNLDQSTGQEILKILGSLNRQSGLTIVMVTHDPSIAKGADRQVRLVDGRVALE